MLLEYAGMVGELRGVLQIIMATAVTSGDFGDGKSERALSQIHQIARSAYDKAGQI